MNADVERRLRYVLSERDQCRGRIVALLREFGVLRFLRSRIPPDHRSAVDALVSLVSLEREFSDVIARELERNDDEVDEE
jgi:hypothetical protein